MEKILPRLLTRRGGNDNILSCRIKRADNGKVAPAPKNRAKKPEHAVKLFIRFALAKAGITYGMELMLALFNIVQGTIGTIMTLSLIHILDFFGCL